MKIWKCSEWSHEEKKPTLYNNYPLSQFCIPSSIHSTTEGLRLYCLNHRYSDFIGLVNDIGLIVKERFFKPSSFVGQETCKIEKIPYKHVPTFILWNRVFAGSFLIVIHQSTYNIFIACTLLRQCDRQETAKLYYYRLNHHLQPVLNYQISKFWYFLCMSKRTNLIPRKKLSDGSCHANWLWLTDCHAMADWMVAQE